MTKGTGRVFAKIKSAIWEDDDFRALPPPAQHLYFVILTDPELTYCGIADWRPRRILPKAAGWTLEDLYAAAAILTGERLLIVDEDTEEVLVRSFLRHDEVMQHNKLCISAVRAISAIASNMLRGVAIHELHRLKNENPEWAAWERDQVKSVLKRKTFDPALAPPLAPKLAPDSAPGLGATPAPRLASALQQQQQLQHSTATSSKEESYAPDKSDASRGTRIPDNFQITKQMETWAKEYTPNIDIHFLLPEFIDYWKGVSGSKGIKRDWVATWRNGMRMREKWAHEDKARSTTGYQTQDQIMRSMWDTEPLPDLPAIEGGTQ